MLQRGPRERRRTIIAGPGESLVVQCRGAAQSLQPVFERSEIQKGRNPLGRRRDRLLRRAIM